MAFNKFRFICGGLAHENQFEQQAIESLGVRGTKQDIQAFRGTPSTGEDERDLVSDPEPRSNLAATLGGVAEVLRIDAVLDYPHVIRSKRFGHVWTNCD